MLSFRMNAVNFNHLRNRTLPYILPGILGHGTAPVLCYSCFEFGSTMFLFIYLFIYLFI